MNLPKPIFLSHANEDAAALARAICGFFEDRGLPCWLDERDIRPGDHYDGAVIKGVDDSSLLVVILSPAVNDSNAVANEVDRAFRRGIPILPFRVKHFELSGRLAFYLGTIQSFDATAGRPEDHFAALYEQCLAMQMGTLPPPQTLKSQNTGKRSLFLLALAPLVALALYFWLRPASEKPQPQSIQDSAAIVQRRAKHDTTKPDTHAPIHTTAFVPPPTTASHTSATSPRLLLDLEGARFVDGSSEALETSDHQIIFLGIHGNEIGFTAKFEGYNNLQGKMRLQGNTLEAVTGDVTGSVVLLDHGTRLEGKLIVRSSGAGYDVHFTKLPNERSPR